MIGTKLAHYEITAHLGSGGMGDVYQATDLKLKRRVAIKLLPEAFSSDPERLSRFRREAEVLASLNHPNVAQIFGIEESGDKRCIVMELVEGETLQARIKRGPIPVDEALSIAKQIGQALEDAHEKGVIHRDLKPANVMLTSEEKVKVLDFGLAKAMSGANASATARSHQTMDAIASSPVMSNSPTMASLAATNIGVILGTAAYMSPEQVKGRTVDKRTDIFAFGCVLYEMLTGQPAFDGDDVADILGAILKSEPDWNRLPPSVSLRVRELLRLCLEKNARQRRHDAGDVVIDIEQALMEPATTPAASHAPGSRAAWIVSVAVLAMLVVVLAIPALRYLTQSPAVQPQLHMTAELGADATLEVNQSIALALSPDGTLLVFVGNKAGSRQLYLRHFDQLESMPLSGTANASDPFFSPDDQWIGFFADGKLKKISVAGGAAVTLADAPDGRGGSWGDDDNIVFTADARIGASLMRVSATGGGAVEPQTKFGAGEVGHRWPQVLPGNRGILYTSTSNNTRFDEANIMVQPLPAGPPRIVQRGSSYGRYLPCGHLLYIHDGTLFAVPFNLAQLVETGTAVPVIESVATSISTGRAQFAFSASGALAYVPGRDAGTATPIVWMGRDGKTTPLWPAPSDWSDPQFSPDGRTLAVDINDGKQSDISVYDWASDTPRKLTVDGAEDRKPVWTSTGDRIVFASNRGDGATLNLWWQRADGAGTVERLTDSRNFQYPGSWHPRLPLLVFQESNPQTAGDVMILPMEGDEVSGWKPGKPIPFRNSRANEVLPKFSPDGRWIAYQSNEAAGQDEVFVAPYPGRGGPWQISTAGGKEPVWSHKRQELYYRTLDDHIMVASYAVAGDSFKKDKPKLWSDQTIQARSRREGWFDLDPDGDRIAVAVAPTQTGAPEVSKAVFILNFFDELRRKAPAAKP